ncbi:hypothetical protein CCACVL1_07775 [Corchorus capsularis]|uniref:Aspartic peptidase n=1 Tax=Corchorus capsularis TaxID=210143 RepID=A0A1R3J417_COCAP|nr:hypothetical protein CCACVL1_07775 [Corchorus capsularis]
MEENQPWYTKEMESPIIPTSIPPSYVCPTPPTSTLTAVSSLHAQMPRDDNTIVERVEEEKDPVSSSEVSPTPTRKEEKPKKRKKKMMETTQEPPPYPQRLISRKRICSKDDQLNSLCKLEVNILIVAGIEKVPMYASFLKQLCTDKKELRENNEYMNENVSAAFQRKLPHKCKDLGSLSIPCSIGGKRIEKATCDLGASINIMPYSVYEKLGLEHIIKTKVIIQLADRTDVRPEGLVEDVLVQVGKFVFPANFYILKMSGDDQGLPLVPILFGRTFLLTARARISVHDGKINLEFDGEALEFDIYKTMKYPVEKHSVFAIDSIDLLVDHVTLIDRKDELETIITNSLDKEEVKES